MVDEGLLPSKDWEPILGNTKGIEHAKELRSLGAIDGSDSSIVEYVRGKKDIYLIFNDKYFKTAETGRCKLLRIGSSVIKLDGETQRKILKEFDPKKLKGKGNFTIEYDNGKIKYSEFKNNKKKTKGEYNESTTTTTNTNKS